MYPTHWFPSGTFAAKLVDWHRVLKELIVRLQWSFVSPYPCIAASWLGREMGQPPLSLKLATLRLPQGSLSARWHQPHDSRAHQRRLLLKPKWFVWSSDSMKFRTFMWLCSKSRSLSSTCSLIRLTFSSSEGESVSLSSKVVISCSTRVRQLHTVRRRLLALVIVPTMVQLVKITINQEPKNDTILVTYPVQRTKMYVPLFDYKITIQFVRLTTDWKLNSEI